MARISWLKLLPLAIFAAFAGIAGAALMRNDPGQLPSVLIGREVPPLPTETLPGKTQLTIDMLKQPGVKLVNFWASWCPPCRAEHPTLTELSKTVSLYGVNLKDVEANALDFLNSHGDPYQAIATDRRGRGAIDWGVTAPPETFIINGKGEILFRFAGPLIGDDLEQRFMPELEKALAAEK